MTHLKLNSELSLSLHKLPLKPLTTAPVPVNYYWVVDISGSMYGQLARLREHLKQKMFELVKPIDTVTLIAFSGKNECYTLFNNESVVTASDKQQVLNTIDTYLVARGLTGFKQPLQEVLSSISALSKKSLVSLFFMTDGYDNQWSDSEILNVCKELAPRLDSATIVEYGWYCNHTLLTKMSEVLGASLLFGKELSDYSGLFENYLNQNREKRIPIELDRASAFDWVFCVNNDTLVVLPVENKVCLVPESVTEIGYFSVGSASDLAPDHTPVHPLSWLATGAASQQGKTDLVFDILKHSGDVSLIQTFTNCFSKEDYIGFQAECVKQHLNANLRYSCGFDRSAVPDENAYTVLDLLEDLSADDENLFYPYHEQFNYQRISAATEIKDKDESLKFNISDTSKGYAINALTWNESRPNVSIQIRVNGFVDLPNDKPANLPEKFDTFIYRNYTIIKDGIVHTRTLPVSLSLATFATLQSKGLLTEETWKSGKLFWLDYSKVPVINRKMVKSVNAEEFFKLILELNVLKGRQKVLNDLKNKYAPRESTTFKLIYGEDSTAWLKEKGLTDYSGFSPSVKIVKGDDVYVGYELTTAVKGASSLPKVDDVRKALISNKPLKISEQLMKAAVLEADAALSSEKITKSDIPEEAAKAWIKAASEAAVKNVRKINKRLSQLKFSIVVGHVWFDDFASTPGEASKEVKVDSLDSSALVTASLKEIEVKI